MAVLYLCQTTATKKWFLEVPLIQCDYGAKGDRKILNTNAINDFSGFKLSGSSLSVPPWSHVALIQLKNGSEVGIDENLKSVRKENIR
jgi:hypothetical protein